MERRRTPTKKKKAKCCLLLLLLFQKEKIFSLWRRKEGWKEGEQKSYHIFAPGAIFTGWLGRFFLAQGCHLQSTKDDGIESCDVSNFVCLNIPTSLFGCIPEQMSSSVSQRRISHAESLVGIVRAKFHIFFPQTFSAQSVLTWGEYFCSLKSHNLYFFLPLPPTQNISSGRARRKKGH